MSPLIISLSTSTLLCTLTAGIALTFATVVMPGIRRLDDLQFLRAFKHMDGIIQNNQPIFMFVWVGSALAILTSAIIGTIQLEGWNRNLLVIAALLYLFGVQAPTVSVNVPLNNALQELDLESLSPDEIQDTRTGFESRWNT